MKRLLQLMSILMITGLAACSLDHQQVTLTPRIENATSQIGRGQPVYLVVNDVRSSRLLGYRIDETKDRAEITAANDVRQVIYDNVKQILVDNGFEVVPDQSTAAPRFSVDIRDLQYKASGKYVAPSVTTSAVFKGTAQRPDRSFSKDYEINRKEREALPLTSERNARIINAIVSDVLTMMADDKDMFSFLAGATVNRGDTGYPD